MKKIEPILDPSTQLPKITGVVAFEANGSIHRTRFDAAKAHVEFELQKLLPNRQLGGFGVTYLWGGNILEHREKIKELLAWLDLQEKSEQ